MPWYLVCLSAPAWALLRVQEKNAGSPPSEDDDELREEEWDKAA